MARGRVQQPRGAAAIYEMLQIDLRSRRPDWKASVRLPSRLRSRDRLNLDAKRIHSLVMYPGSRAPLRDASYTKRFSISTAHSSATPGHAAGDLYHGGSRRPGFTQPPQARGSTFLTARVSLGIGSFARPSKGRRIPGDRDPMTSFNLGFECGQMSHRGGSPGG